MNLGEIYNYKNKLMEIILTDADIVRLIDDSVPLNDSAKLMYSKVFPYQYIPDTVEEAGTFVCFDVDVTRSMNKTKYNPMIYVWVISHKSLLKLDAGGLRVDTLTSKIVEQLNGNRYFGLGELDFYSAKRYAPTEAYQGKVLTFDAVEFNRSSPTGKPIPSNREKGV